MATLTSSSRLKTSGSHYKSGTYLFLSFFGRNGLLLSGAIILLIANTILNLVPAIIIGQSIDILETQGYGRVFVTTAGIILGVAILNYIMSSTANYVFAVTATAFERDLRQEYFDIIQDHSLRFHDENNSSKLLALGMNEIQFIRHGIMPSLRMIIQSFLSIALVSIYLTQLVQLEIVFLVIGGFVFYFIFAYRYARKIGPVRGQLSENLGDLTERSQEIFRGIEVVRSFSSQEKEINRFNRTSEEYANTAKIEARLSAFYIPSLILLLITAIVFILTLQDVPQLLTIGEMVQVLGLLISLQFLNFMMPFAILNIRAALTNSKRIWEKMNYVDKQEVRTVKTTTKVDWKGDLKFDNVTFSYGEKYGDALRNVNITLPAKSKVALIGGPGSGKTSFLKLLLDLYQPQFGNISVGGVNYREISDKEIRSHVAMVEQEVFLFSGTIRENIAFTRRQASDEEIMGVAKTAKAWEFIQKMPDKLETVIGERGVTLSGGQRQRIAIARVILADPDILLLDDSSSAIDSKTELQIREALENVSKDRLTITVTQRLRTLVEADLIVLLHKGEVNGMGTHEELLQTNPKYQKIFELLPENERLIDKGGHH